MNPSLLPFFVAGGTLRHDVPSYVERRADGELLDALRAGEFCYVLTARQVGKSSLMVRAAARLRDGGIRTAILDLSALGQNVTPEQWYRALLVQLGIRLDCEERLEACWHARPDWAPLQRFLGALESLLEPDGGAAAAGAPLVVFIDEIDAVRSLPFPTDELFAAIRACYNRRPDDDRMRRLTFCLLGVASPSDLIRDPRVTPFNIGRRIDLPDFTPSEALPLAAGFAREGAQGHPGGGGNPEPGRDSGFTAQRLLRRVLYWTGGHPYLTQRLCRGLVESLEHAASGGAAGTPSRADVDRVCRELFLQRGARERDENLIFVRERILRAELPHRSRGESLSALLERYREVRTGRRVPDDGTDPLVDTLKLAGIVRTDGGRLAVRNRIYARAFDSAWIARQLPDAEVRRQRAAYRRGLLRATGLAGAVVAVVGGLAVVALGQAGAARAAGRLASASAAGLREALAEQGRTLARLKTALAERDVQRASALRSRAQAVREAGQARRSAAEARESSRSAERSAAEARLARRAAVTRGRESQERLVALTAARGAEAVDQGDLFGGLVWYARAAALAPRSPEEQRLHELRAGALLRSLPRLIHVWFGTPEARLTPDRARLITLDESGRLLRVLNAATLRPALAPLRAAEGFRDWHISGDGRHLVAEEGSRLRVWDLKQGTPGAAVPFDWASTWRLSPDAACVVTAGREWVDRDEKGEVRRHYDAVARVWDPRTGRAVTPEIRTPGPSCCVAFDPTGRTFAVGSIDGYVGRWEAATGRPLGEPLAVRDAPAMWEDHISTLEFSSDGERLLAITRRGVALWDAEGRRVAPPLEHPFGGVSGARFSPDSRLIATQGGGDHSLLVWDAATGRRITPPLPHTAPVRSFAFSPDSRRVATASNDGTARVWDARSGEPLSPPLPHGSAVVWVDFDASGTRLVTRDAERRLRLWDLTAGEARTLRHPGAGHLSTAAWSPDGRQLLAAQSDGSIQIRDAATGRSLGAWQPTADRVEDLMFSRKGDRLLEVAGAGVRVWKSASGPIRLTQLPSARPVLLPHSAPVREAVFSDDGRRILVAGGLSAAVWDSVKGRRLGVFAGLESNARTAALSADGARAAVGTMNGHVLIGDAATGRVLADGWHRNEVTAVEFSPDGRLLLTASGDRTACLWDARSGRLLRTLRHREWVHHAAFSPDGRLVVTASGWRHDRFGEARLWSVRTGAPVGPPMIHQGGVLHAAFSPDGRLVATSSADRTTRVWWAATSEAVSPPLRQPGEVWASLFAPGGGPGGYRLLSGSNDGTLHVWDLPRWTGSVAELERAAAVLSVSSMDRVGGSMPMPAETYGRELMALYGPRQGGRGSGGSGVPLRAAGAP